MALRFTALVEAQRQLRRGTPDVTRQGPNRPGRSLDIIGDNVRRYRAEQTLINRLRAEDVDTKGYPGG